MPVHDAGTIVTALMLIAVPVAFNLAFFLLQQSFDYPDILRRPTGEVLKRFAAGGPRLRLLWYGFALSAVLFTPVPVLVDRLFGADRPWFLGVATVFGVLAGVVQFVGLLRWSFLLPSLAELYLSPGSSPATRDAAAVTFHAFHRYVGVAIGEHLGYVFTAVWTILVCIAITQASVVAPLLGWLGLVPAIGIFLGVFEEAGVKAAAIVNAISYVLWSLWLIALGVTLLF